MVTRSARWPTAIAPASAKPRLSCAVPAASSSAAVQWPRCWVASRSSISRPRISSNRSITAWLSLPSVSRQPASCSRRPGRCRRRGRARWSGRSRRWCGVSPSRRDVVVGEVGGVHDGGARAEQPRRRASSWVGVTPYAARQASFSATCSERWTCSGASRPRTTVAAGRAARRAPSGSRRRRAAGRAAATRSRPRARRSPSE